MELSECVCNFYGKVLFVNNTAAAALTFDEIIALPQGGAISSNDTVLLFNNSAVFQGNEATVPEGSLLGFSAVGGAIAACPGSTVIIAERVSVGFTLNSANSMGGAISISSSEFILQGQVIFEKNSVSEGGGGAIAGTNCRLYVGGGMINDCRQQNRKKIRVIHQLE